MPKTKEGGYTQKMGKAHGWTKAQTTAINIGIARKKGHKIPKKKKGR